MASKPSIVIIPGSFSFASSYYELVDEIQQLGCEAFVNNLPSATRNPPEQPASLHDDAVFFRSIINDLADQGKNVIVLGHSYGGVVAIESVEGLGAVDRKARGLGGGVVRLVFLAAVVPIRGVSTKDELGIKDMQNPAPGRIAVSKDGFMRVADFQASAKDAYPELDSAAALEIAKKTTKHSALSFTGELTYPAYKYLPSSYIFCEYDKTIPPILQRKFIERLKTESGKEVDVCTLETGHTPNITEPKTLAHTVVNIANRHKELADAQVEI